MILFLLIVSTLLALIFCALFMWEKRKAWIQNEAFMRLAQDYDHATKQQVKQVRNRFEPEAFKACTVLDGYMTRAQALSLASFLHVHKDVHVTVLINIPTRVESPYWNNLKHHKRLHTKKLMNACEYLYRYGGLYFALNTVWYKDVRTCMSSNDPWIYLRGRSKPQPSYNIIYSPAGHPLLRKHMDEGTHFRDFLRKPQNLFDPYFEAGAEDDYFTSANLPTDPFIALRIPIEAKTIAKESAFHKREEELNRQCG